MEIWAKKKKDHHREYRSTYKVVNIRHEKDGYVYVCDVSAVIRDVKIRYGFISCECPIQKPKVVPKPKPTRSKKKVKSKVKPTIEQPVEESKE